MKPPSGAPLRPKHREKSTTRELRSRSLSSERECNQTGSRTKDITPMVMQELFDCQSDSPSSSKNDKIRDSNYPKTAISQSEEETQASMRNPAKRSLTREPKKADSRGPHTSEAESPNCLAEEITTKSNDDGGSWRPVGEKGKRRRLAPLSPPPSLSLGRNFLTNRFSPIAPREERREETENMDTNNTTRKQRIPPLLIANSKDWSKKFRIIRKACEFQTLVQLSVQKVIVKCQTTNDFFSAKNALSNNKIEFFTYRLPTEKETYYVIRNLPADITTDKIAESLVEFGVPAAKIVQLRTSRPTPTQMKQGITSLSPPRPLPLFQILPQTTSPEEIFDSLQYICNMKVKIEKFRPPSGPPQCHRCQLFGHTMKACQMNFRCVKCGPSHPSSECQRSITAAPTCVNCKGNHPANHRGCPAYKSIKERLVKLKESAKQASGKPNVQPPPVNSATFPTLISTSHESTYASVTSSEPTPLLAFTRVGDGIRSPVIHCRTKEDGMMLRKSHKYHKKLERYQ
ncbi:hypothetical protein J437_LFUL006808 [Ladona fulva]|uniref:Gag-like protein n=1 Tax=Ladona fulva TaxID=123851 RepID=A0A8K0K600_LADFU|nr:hypothetical protein J437_LFUL006808 [Ladona fulva]